MVDRFRELQVPDESIRFLPLGASVDAIDPAKALERSPELIEFASFEGLRVVFTGSLIPRKSVHTLLLAARELAETGTKVACLLVGDGPCKDQLMDEAARPGAARTFFAGSQPPRLIPSYMALGEVLVLPSRAEGRGMVVVEAMATGLAVVASAIDGPRELVEDGVTGLLFHVGDHAGLAACLRRLDQNPELAATLARTARERIRAAGLTAELAAERHLGLYQDVLACHVPACK
jgi:2-deoxystreptamine N-acetyl-D-glucosaminyltransferase/2-deoxystreptamine glucosyltransferase